MSKHTENYLIHTAIGLLSILFLYLGWGDNLLHWMYDIPVIKHLLSPNRGLIFNIVFLIAIIISVFYVYRLIKRDLYKPSPFHTSVYIGVLIVLLTCQYNGNWIFYKANYYGWEIAYWDLIGCIPAAILKFSLIRIICEEVIKRRESKNKDDHRTATAKMVLNNNDRPIDTEEEDWLGRKTFAEELAKRVLNQNVENESSSVAIIAPWGNGKTSFLNLIKGQIRKSGDSKHVLIDFSPWAYTSPVNVSKTFFETLASAVRPLDRKLSSVIERYMMVLSDIDVPLVSTVSRFLVSDNTLHTLYNLVRNGLKNSDKVFIVFIDDVDRLQASEILEVLKLIRGSANFPNLKFICAFDKHYVVSELKTKSTALSDKFIEKFFHVEYWLPTYNLEKIQSAILNTCRDFLADEDYIAFEEFITINDRQSFGKSRHPLRNGIENLRIANRWIRSFKLAYTSLQGNVLVDNLADIELLKLIAPSFFDTLRTNWLSYVEETNSGLKLCPQKTVDAGNHENDLIRELFAEEKHDIFKSNAFETLSSETKTHVNDILSRLLPEYGAGKDKAFSNRNYTDRYFFNLLQDDEITETEFEELMSKDLDDIKKELKASSFSNKFKWFSILIAKYNPINLDALLKYFHIVFYAGRISSDFKIDPIDFVYKLKPYKDDAKRISDEFKQIIIQNRSSNFTLSFFTYMEHNVPDNMYKPFFYNLSSQIVALDMLKYAIEDGKEFSEINKYFWSTGKYKHTNGKEEYIPNDEAVELYRKYWTDNFRDLYVRLIHRQMPPMDDDVYVAADLITILWPDTSNFFNIFDNLEKDEFLTDAEAFFRQALANEHKLAQFKFKHIKIKSND